MDIQTKDGILLRGIPDGTPDDVIKARIATIRAEKSPAVTPPTQPDEPTLPERIAANSGVRFFTGASAPIRGLLEKIPGSIGQSWKDTNQQLTDMQKRGLMNETGAGKFASGTGELAGEMLSPVSLGASKIAPAATMLGRTAQNAGIGGAFGLMAPTGNEGNPLVSGGLGAAAGAVIPAVLGAPRGAQAVKDAIYPSVGRLGLRAAGDKADDVIAALKTTQSGTPGVNLTAGQASVPANSAEFAAFQNAVALENPSKFYGPSGVKGQQESARVAAVRSFGKTPTELESAVTARSATSAKNYGDAWKTQIKGDPELAMLFKNPYVKDAIPEALKLAQANGITAKSDLTQFLHFIKEGLDAKLQTANNPNMPAISNAAKSAVTDAKSTLVSWLGKKNPAYDTARLSHIADSTPINQMKVGQELERALVAPSTGSERAASFGSKVRQAETKISKGSGRPQIAALSQSQRDVVSAITQDFLRNQQFKDLASAGTKGMQERIGAPTVPPTGAFQPMISAARSWVNKGLGTGHEQALRRAAEVMDNPQEMARLMEAATPTQRLVIEEIARRGKNPMIGTVGMNVGSDN